MNAAADTETLFSLELLVDCVQFEPEPGPAARPGPVLAVAFRLLDFPTLLVHQTTPERAEGKVGPPEGPPAGSRVPFGKGKCCLLKLSLTSLSHSPLYTMLLDVVPRVPRLLGSCVIPLAGAAEEIRRQVEQHGMAVPAVHGGKGLYAVYNLMGREVGHIALRYRLLSLGVASLPHVPHNQVLTVAMGEEDSSPGPSAAPVVPSGPLVLEQIQEEQETVAQQVTGNTPSRSAQSPDPVPGGPVIRQHIQLGESEVPATASVSKKTLKPKTLAKGIQMEHNTRLQRLETEESTDIGVDNVFCPPPLYYSQSTGDCKETLTEMHRIVETEFRPLEELDSDEDGESFGMSQTLSNSRLLQSQSETASRLNPQVPKMPTQPDADLGNIIRQLPLLNALLLELSLLQDQVPRRIALTVHPQLAWLYSGLENDSPKFHNPIRSPSSEHLRSTSSHFKKHKEKQPISLKLFDKENTQKQTNTKKDSEHPKRKLMFGLTHTLRLRLQQTNPNVLTLLDQRELSRKRQLEQRKEKKAAGMCYKGKGERGSSMLLQHLPGALSGCFEENIETLIQNSVDLDSPHSSKVLRNGKPRGKNNFGATSELGSATSKGQVCVQSLGSLNHSKFDISAQRFNKATNYRILIGKDVKISLPKIFNHDSDLGVIEEVDVLQTPEMNPGFTIDPTIVENSAAQISSHRCNDSPDPKYSEDFTSPEPMGYSEDFTNPEPTSRCADTMGNSTEAASTRVKCIYSDNESEFSFIKHSSDSQGAAQSEREDDSIPLPALSQRSPIRSLKGIHVTKSHQQRMALSSAASNLSDDATSSIEGNELRNILNLTNKEETKKQRKSTILQASRAVINPASTEAPQLASSRNGHRSLEESQSLVTSPVSSYVPSSVSDLVCSGLEMNTTDIQKDDMNELGTMEIVNEYRHISELVANKLPGYTL
uniref:microtubule-associated protein 10 n=1 Tax=Pristiophorus japonicus TaxID=55135 RepID=UPI00398EEC99